MPHSEIRSPDFASPANGESTPRELFALSDEQILEIEPEAAPASPAATSAVIPSEPAGGEPRDRGDTSRVANIAGSRQDSSASVGMTDSAIAPPKWLADRMNDPWNGEEARNFWQGIQQEREVAAAYRGVFAKPDDARAAADRSRQLEQIDGLYFGSAGKSPEQAAAAREQLAQTLLQQDPAAFREMVFAGLRALEKSNVAVAFRPPSSAPDNVQPSTDAGQKPGAAQAPHDSRITNHDSLLNQYAAFEKAANEELDRDVGGTIARVLEQALPVAQPLLAGHSDRAADGAQARVPVLHDRLAAAVRKDVEAALKNDRQLAEQVARLLEAKRFDDATRAQVVRLIGERARQLVPGAARRVLNDWTQTALSAHRARTQRANAVSSRPDIAPDVAQAFGPEEFRGSRQARENSAGLKARATASDRRIDYRRLSDEQILNL